MVNVFLSELVWDEMKWNETISRQRQAFDINTTSSEFNWLQSAVYEASMR